MTASHVICHYHSIAIIHGSIAMLLLGSISLPHLHRNEHNHFQLSMSHRNSTDTLFKEVLRVLRMNTIRKPPNLWHR